MSETTGEQHRQYVNVQLTVDEYNQLMDTLENTEALEQEIYAEKIEDEWGEIWYAGKGAWTKARAAMVILASNATWLGGTKE